MPTLIPRKEFSELPATMFLRPRRPQDHRDFEMILPWATPQLVYAMNDQDWVRWSIPPEMAEKFGIASGGCVCCGHDAVAVSDDGDYQFDTALHEINWWLAANGYTTPTSPLPTLEGEPS